MAQAKRIKNSTDLSVSVIVPTKNRPKELLACIDSLSKQSTKPLEIVIIDQSKTDDCRETVNSALRNSGIKLLYIWNNKLPGLTHARNLGIEKCNGSTILFLDDDVILDKDYIKHILGVYKNDKEGTVGGVGGLVESMLQGRNPRTKKMAYYLFRQGPFRDFKQEFYWNPRGITPSNLLSGCDMSYRAEVFHYFNFDENFMGYSRKEDEDFSYRVSTKYRLLLTPYAKLVHKQIPTARDSLEKLYNAKIFNCYYFFVKNIPKSTKNCLCYSWLNIGFMLDVIAKHRLPIIKGTLVGYGRIIKSLIKNNVAEELKNI